MARRSTRDDDSFLAVCDVLSLHAPGGEGTRHWLDAERIAKLPKGAIVANAARGTLIDDDALIAALTSGQVAAAGLDVYNNEPKLAAGYFALENVVLLPHLGSATTETRDSMGHLVLDGIERCSRAGRRATSSPSRALRVVDELELAVASVLRRVASSRRRSTRRILPEIVFGSS